MAQSIPDFLQILQNKRRQFNFLGQDDPQKNPFSDVGGLRSLPKIGEPTVSPLNAPPVQLGSPLERLRDTGTPDRDIYTKYLDSEPERGDYQHGKLGKILASIAGFSEGLKGGPATAYKTSKGILDQPYREAREGWESKGARLKEKAELEYQSLSDREKLEIQITKDQLDRLKEAREQLKDAQGRKLSDVQIENLYSQIKSRNEMVIKDEVDGITYVIDKNDPSKRTPIGQYHEALGDKRAHEEKVRKDEQRDRVSLANLHENAANLRQQAGFTHAESMAKSRFTNEQEMEKFKREIKIADKSFESLSPAEQKTTMELAYAQAVVDGYNPEDHATFATALRERATNIRNLSISKIPKVELPRGAFGSNATIEPFATTIPSKGNTASSTMTGNVASMTGAVPEVTMPGTQPPINPMADAEARKALADIGITNPNPAQLAEAIKDLGL